MKMKKKILASLLALSLFAGMMVPVMAENEVPPTEADITPIAEEADIAPIAETRAGTTNVANFAGFKDAIDSGATDITLTADITADATQLSAMKQTAGDLTVTNAMPIGTVTINGGGHKLNFGLIINGSSTVTLNNLKITVGNTISHTTNGTESYAVWAQGSNTVVINNCELSATADEASVRTRAVAVSADKPTALTVTNSKIIAATTGASTNKFSYGIFVSDPTAVTVTGNTFAGCDADFSPQFKSDTASSDFSKITSLQACKVYFEETANAITDSSNGFGTASSTYLEKTTTDTVATWARTWVKANPTGSIVLSADSEKKAERYAGTARFYQASLDSNAISMKNKMDTTKYAAIAVPDYTPAITFGWASTDDATRNTWQGIISLDPKNELGGGEGHIPGSKAGYGLIANDTSKKVTGSTTIRIEQEEGSNAGFVTYAKVNKKWGTDFDSVVFKRNGTVTDTFVSGTTAATWIKLNTNDTYMKWGNYFAKKEGNTWYRTANTYKQEIEFYLNDVLVGKMTPYTIDMSGVTSPAMKQVAPPTTNYPTYSGGGSSTPTTTPSSDLSTIISNSAVSANTPKGTEVEVPSSISDPTFDTKEVAVNAPEAKEFVNTAANAGFAFAKVFQMNLFDGTTKVTKVDDGRVKISIPFAGKTGYDYVVLRYETNGGVTAMPALYKDGQITFTTDHFSLYAIAVKSNDKNLFADTTVKPTTGTSVPQTAVCGLTKLF